MAPSDVAGVFSRYFIIGFFLPAFFVLVGLSQTLSADLLPSSYESLSGGAQIAVLGGTGLLLGLLLQGLNWQVFRLFEGYPLVQKRHSSGIVKWIHDLFVRRQAKAFDSLIATRDGADDDAERSNAAWKLDREFPASRDQLMPTRFGNAVLAFETHANTRWGLDSIAVWPRIDMLLSDREAELQANARGEAAFFINGSLLLVIAGLLLVADEIGNCVLGGWRVAAYSIPFLASAVVAAWAVGAATRWGNTVRAAIDIHRFGLYDKLGVRRPRNFRDEREHVSLAVNEALLYGRPIPDDLFAPRSTSTEEGDP